MLRNSILLLPDSNCFFLVLLNECGFLFWQTYIPKFHGGLMFRCPDSAREHIHDSRKSASVLNQDSFRINSVRKALSRLIFEENKSAHELLCLLLPPYTGIQDLHQLGDNWPFPLDCNFFSRISRVRWPCVRRPSPRSIILPTASDFCCKNTRQWILVCHLLWWWNILNLLQTWVSSSDNKDTYGLTEHFEIIMLPP